MPPPSNHSRDDDRPSPTRNFSGFVINKIRRLTVSRATSITQLSTAATTRVRSGTPSSPSLPPTTSVANAPGVLVQPSTQSQGAESPLTIETLIPKLTPPIAPQLSLQVLESHITTLTRLLRGGPPFLPSFDSIFSVLSHLCSPHSLTDVRHLGFNLMATYLECLAEPLSEYDRVRLWSLIRSKSVIERNPETSADDWDARLVALSTLTRKGEDIESLVGLVNTLVVWDDDLSHSYFPLLRNAHTIDVVSQRFDVERRLAKNFGVIADVLKYNMATISETDEDALIGALQTSLDTVLENIFEFTIVAAGRFGISPEDTPTAPQTQLVSSSRSSSRAPSLRHRRHPSSQSSRVLPRRPSLSPASTTFVTAPSESTFVPAPPSFLLHASAYLNLLTSLSQHAPLPSKHIRPIIRTLLVLLAELASDLPKVTDHARKSRGRPSGDTFDGETTLESPSTLEDKSWLLISSLLSENFTSTTVYEIKKLLLHPDPLPSQTPHSYQVRLSAKYAHGAARVMRFALRKAATHRIAVSRLEDLEETYSPAGLPLFSQDTEEIMHALYGVGAGEGSFWDATRIRGIVGPAVRMWRGAIGGEPVLMDFLGIVKDVLDELQATSRPFTEDEGHVVGGILWEAAQCLRESMDPALPSGRRKLIQTLSEVLYQIPLETPLTPSPAEILLSVADSITDDKGASIVNYAFQALPYPAANMWLPTIKELFERLNRSDTPLSRRALAKNVRRAYDDVRELAEYRDPLVRIALTSWERTLLVETDFDTVEDVMTVLEDGIVAGAADPPSTSLFRAPYSLSSNGLDQRIQLLLLSVASNCECPEDAYSSTPVGGYSYNGHSSCDQKDLETPKDSPLNSPLPQSSGPSMAATLKSTPASSSSTPITNHGDAPFSDTPNIASPEPITTNPIHNSVPHRDARCKSMTASLTLIRTFMRLAFSPPHSLDSDSPFKTARAPASSKCITIFENLLSLLGPSLATAVLPEGEERMPGHRQASCRRARLAILQWMVRLRADRDHRLCVVGNLDTEAEPFAALIKRSPADECEATETTSSTPAATSAPPPLDTERDARLARSATQRGRKERGPHDSSRTPSQSRSKSQLPVSPRDHPNSNGTLTLEPIWRLPDILPFDIPPESVRPSEGMTTYSADVLEHDGITKSLWLTVSLYVCTLTDVLHDETDWEILSYALCYLPLQLSNKHLFCGPRTRRAIGNLLSVLCTLILSERVGSKTVLPSDLKVPDVYGLAYQTLTILIGHRDTFDSHDRGLSEQIVQAFTLGLNKHHTLAKPCLQALSICAHELQSSTAKYLPQILEKLVQIMSQPTISRHILELLAIMGTIPELFSNLREIHFTLIFTAAGRYIQRHSRPVQVSMSSTGVARVGGESFALAQHVNILAFYVIYIWFLGIKLPERQRYISSISKYMSMANEGGNEAMMEMVEICLEWLARYTYSNAAPKPSHAIQLGQAIPEAKSWLMGNSILTIEDLSKPGWVAITSRRPSGILHLTTRIDNITLEKLEEVNIDSLLSKTSVAVKLNINAENGAELPAVGEDKTTVTNDNPHAEVDDASSGVTSESDNLDAAVAPTFKIRFDDFAIDPSFLALQLSQFPQSDVGPPNLPCFIPHDESFARALRVLDRTPVVDLHKIGVMYAGPGQVTEEEILSNEHGSPAYTRFLHGLGRLIELKGQRDLYPGGLDTSEDLLDGPYAYAWWDEITQIVFHAATMMPNRDYDTRRTLKKKHIGNDWVRIIWNDSGIPYRFDMIATAFQLVNIIIEPHSAGTIAAFSNSSHENEFFKLTLQRAPGMPEFGPVGEFKLLSAKNLASYVRQVSLLASLFAEVYDWTKRDTVQDEYVTNWRKRLQLIKKLGPLAPNHGTQDHLMGGEATTFGDFTPYYSPVP